jgi:hypothetical protein
MTNWGFLTKHGRALVCIAHDPGVRLRDIATELEVTERSAYGIVNDLAEAGYVVKDKEMAVAIGTRFKPTCRCEKPSGENRRSARCWSYWSKRTPPREPAEGVSEGGSGLASLPISSFS